MAARPASSSRDGGASSEPVTHGNDKRHPGEVNPFELEYPLTWLKIAEVHVLASCCYLLAVILNHGSGLQTCMHVLFTFLRHCDILFFKKI